MILSTLVATCGFLKGVTIGAVAAAVLYRNGLVGGRSGIASGWGRTAGGSQ